MTLAVIKITGTSGAGLCCLVMAGSYGELAAG